MTTSFENATSQAIILSGDQLSTMRTCFSRLTDWSTVCAVNEGDPSSAAFLALTRNVSVLRLAASIRDALTDNFILGNLQMQASLTQIPSLPRLIFYLTDDLENPVEFHQPQNQPSVWVVQTTMEQFQQLLQYFSCHVLPPAAEQSMGLPTLCDTAVRVCLRRHDHNFCVFADVFARDVQNKFPTPGELYPLIVRVDDSNQTVPLMWPFTDRHDVTASPGGRAYTLTTQAERETEENFNLQYRSIISALRHNSMDKLHALSPKPTDGSRLHLPLSQIYDDTITSLQRCLNGDFQPPPPSNTALALAATQGEEAPETPVYMVPNPNQLCELANKAVRLEHQALRFAHRAITAENYRACADASNAWAYVSDRMPVYTVHCRSHSGPDQPFHLPVLSLPIPRFVVDTFAAGTSSSPHAYRPTSDNTATVQGGRFDPRFEPRYHGPCFLTGDRLIRVVTHLASAATTGAELPEELRAAVPDTLPVPPEQISYGDQRRPASTILAWRFDQCVDGLSQAMDEALRSIRLGPSFHHRRALFAASLRRASAAAKASGSLYSAPIYLEQEYVTDFALKRGLCTKKEAEEAACHYKRGAAALQSPREAEPATYVPCHAIEVFTRIILHPHIARYEKALFFELLRWRYQQAMYFARICLWRARLSVGRLLTPAAPAPSGRAADVLPAMLARAAEQANAPHIAHMSYDEIERELVQNASQLQVPVAHRVPSRTLFAGFDTQYPDRNSLHASLAHSGADVSAGISFCEAARMFADILAVAVFAAPQAARSSPVPARDLSTKPDSLSAAEYATLRRALNAYRDGIVGALPEQVLQEAPQGYVPGAEDGAWMRMGSLDRNGTMIFRDATIYLTATAVQRVQALFRSIPTELLSLAPATLAATLDPFLAMPAAANTLLMAGEHGQLTSGVAASSSFGEVFHLALVNNMIDQSFGESFATDICPHRFIGPLRFIGAGSFANCFLFFDVATGGAVASKQSTRQWQRLTGHRPVVQGAQLLGVDSSGYALGPHHLSQLHFTATPATAAIANPRYQFDEPNLEQRSAAYSTELTMLQDNTSTEVRLFDYTLREAVNLARCAGRPCCTMVVGEYFSVYTCSHTLMLHYVPTQRLTSVLGRLGAAELQNYLRDLLVGLAASRDASFRPPPQLYHGMSTYHPCAFISSTPPPPLAGDASHDDFYATEFAGLDSAKEFAVVERCASDKLIHRDIKPANFLWHPPHLLPDGTVQFEAGSLIDYGLAVVENGAETLKAIAGAASDRRQRVLGQISDAADWQRENAQSGRSTQSGDALRHLQSYAVNLVPDASQQVVRQPRFRGVLKYTPLIPAVHPVRTARFVSARAGTRGYRAPEMLMGLPHSPASDVWSVGAVFLGLLLAQTDLFAPPRPEFVQVFNAQAVSRLPDFPSQVSYLRPSSGVAIRAVESRTGQVLFELMTIRSLIGAEAFDRVCDHAGVDVIHSYAGSPPGLDEATLRELVRARQPALFNQLEAVKEGQSLYKLVLKMLAWHPQIRPSAAELLQDEFFLAPFPEPRVTVRS